MRHAQTPSRASCLPISAVIGELTIKATASRSLRLSTGQQRQTRRIKMLVTKSPTAVEYASAEHDKQLDIAAGPTREPPPDRITQTGQTTTKGRDLAPLDLIIAAGADRTMGAHGHRPTT